MALLIQEIYAEKRNEQKLICSLLRVVVELWNFGDTVTQNAIISR